MTGKLTLAEAANGCARRRVAPPSSPRAVRRRSSPTAAGMAFSAWQVALHRWVRYLEARILYRPTPDEWCLHVVRRVVYRAEVRALMKATGTYRRHITLSSLSLPWNVVRCDGYGCKTVRRVDRDVLAVEMSANRRLVA